MIANVLICGESYFFRNYFASLYVASLQLYEPCCKLSCIVAQFEVTFRHGFEASVLDPVLGLSLQASYPPHYPLLHEGIHCDLRGPTGEVVGPKLSSFLEKTGFQPIGSGSPDCHCMPAMGSALTSISRTEHGIFLMPELAVQIACVRSRAPILQMNCTKQLSFRTMNTCIPAWPVMQLPLKDLLRCMLP